MKKSGRVAAFVPEAIREKAEREGLNKGFVKGTAAVLPDVSAEQKAYDDKYGNSEYMERIPRRITEAREGNYPIYPSKSTPSSPS